MDSAFRTCYSASAELANGATENLITTLQEWLFFPLAGQTPRRSGNLQGKYNRVGLLGPPPMSGTSWKRKRGLKKKSSSREDSTPNNTVLVAPNDHQANFRARDIRARLLNLFSKGNKGVDLWHSLNSKKQQQFFLGANNTATSAGSKRGLFKISKKRDFISQGGNQATEAN